MHLWLFSVKGAVGEYLLVPPESRHTCSLATWCLGMPNLVPGEPETSSVVCVCMHVSDCDIVYKRET